MHDDHAVPLEVADVELVPEHGDVRGLSHELRALNVADEAAIFIDDEDGRGHRVDHDDVAFARNGQAGHDVDETDRDAADEVAEGRENLHARALVAAVANHEVARLLQHGDLAGLPQVAFFLARCAEGVLKVAILVKNLKYVRCNYDGFIAGDNK